VLGLYYLTRERVLAHGEGRVFSSPAEVRSAYDHQEVDLQARVTCRMDQFDAEGSRPGAPASRPRRPRAALRHPAAQIPFSSINKVMDKKTLGNLIDICYRLCGEKETVLLADRLRSLGYGYATKAGISIAIKDMVIPQKKQEFLERAQKEVARSRTSTSKADHRRRAVQQGDRHLGAGHRRGGRRDDGRDRHRDHPQGGKEKKQPSFNPIFIMADSGARGSAQQIRQLAGMRGLMAKPSGNHRDAHHRELPRRPHRAAVLHLHARRPQGSGRHGLEDRELGLLTGAWSTWPRTRSSPSTTAERWTASRSARWSKRQIIEPMGERILGRVALDDVEDPFNHEIIVKANEEIDETKVKEIEEAGIEKVKIRSV